MDFSEIREIINDAVDMRQVATDLLGMPTKTLSGRVNILCPLPGHNDRDYGSCILKEKGGYCFACNEGFNAIDLVMMVDGCTYIEAVRKLADFYGLNIDFSQDAEPIEPIIISGDIFRFAGITDVTGFKKVFEQDRETAFRYLGIMIARAKNKLSKIDKSALPVEISDIIKDRLKTLEKADRQLPSWKADTDKPLRIK